MPHQHGAHIGGVRTIEDIRLRCHCDREEGGCWHLRTGHGKPLPRGKTHRVWVHGKGSMSAPRAVWEIAHGKAVPSHHRAYRTCDSHDCVNPDHIKAGPHEWYGAAVSKRGVFKSSTQARNARIAGEKRAKLTPELRQWAVESPQTGPQVAHALGVGKTIVYRVRQAFQKRIQRAPASVFAYAQAMNDERRAA